MRQKKIFENKYPYRIVYCTESGNWHIYSFMAKSDAEAKRQIKNMKSSSWIQYCVQKWQYMDFRRYKWVTI